MEIDKVFSNDVDGVADNLFSAVKNSVSEIKAMQQRKAAENVQLVIQALKKIESDLQDKFDGVTTVIEKRVSTIKDGRDGVNGRDGRDGKEGRPGKDGMPGRAGKDGMPGRDGVDGEDGVSVTDARIDFDGSLIIGLSSGREINVGEVVAPDLAERIKVITNGGGTSQGVLDTLASLQAQINALDGFLDYKGTWNASTNTPTLVSSTGTKGDYYVVSVAGSTNLNGETNWGVGDWVVFNNSTWQKVDGGSTGNLTTAVISSSLTLDYGAANGVLYLNGSKVATSGGALTFNGTNLTLTTTSSTQAGYIYNTTSGNAAARNWATTANDQTFGDFAIRQSTGILLNPISSGRILYYINPNGDSIWSPGGSEQMRLNTTGLGIGNVPAANTRITVRTAAQTDAAFAADNGVNTGFKVQFAANLTSIGNDFNNPLAFLQNNSEQMRLTSTGLGIGTSSPAEKLTVQKGNGGIRLDGAGTASSSVWLDYYVPNNGGVSTSSNFAGRIYAVSSGVTDFSDNSIRIAVPVGGSATPVDTLIVKGGNVGIGTSSPGAKLDVRFATNPATNNGGGVNALRVWTTSAIAADSGGAISFGGNADVLGGAAFAQIAGRKDNATSGNYLGYLQFAINNAAGTMSERMRLDSSGNLGIGTSSPGLKVDIAGGGNALRIRTDGSGIGKIQFTDSGVTTDYAYFGTPAANTLAFWTSGSTERMRITSAGDVGIGTSSPGTKLDVIGAGTLRVDGSGTTTPLILRNNNTASVQAVKIGFDSNGAIKASINAAVYGNDYMTFNVGSDTERMRLDSSGNLLVGKTAASATTVGVQAEPAGGVVSTRSGSTDSDVTWYTYSTGAAAARFYVGMGGTVYATNTTISAISDQRFKENIQDLDVGLDKIMALKPRRFDWKTGKGKDIKGDRGFIAQELEQVFPDLVDEWADPAPEGEEPYKSVRQDLIPVLVKAIQELKAEVDSLKSQLEGKS